MIKLPALHDCFYVRKHNKFSMKSAKSDACVALLIDKDLNRQHGVRKLNEAKPKKHNNVSLYKKGTVPGRLWFAGSKLTKVCWAIDYHEIPKYKWRYPGNATITEHVLPEVLKEGGMRSRDEEHKMTKQTPHIITKTRLCKYIENFTSKNWNFLNKKLIFFSHFCSKHGLWVLVRTASARRF